MEAQWPLIIFTLFVCLTCGIMGAISVLTLRGQGEKLQLTSVIVSAVSLVIGGLGAFLHLEHWERIFNGFGHITSGITQELIGCVVLGILLIVWFVMARGGKSVPKALAWVTLIASVAMVCATAHSYLMPARPAWGLALLVFYLTNACLLGPVALWIIASVKKDAEAEKSSIQMTFIGSILQLAGAAVYAFAVATATFANYGHYADPTSMTTAPTHIDSLANLMLMGDGAIMFWSSIVCMAVALACTIAAKRKAEASKTFMVVVLIVAVAASLLFRVLIYILGYPIVLMY